MDRLKLNTWGERLRTGGAQNWRKVSGKVKEILQGPTLAGKMVDEATSDHLEEPNWSINLRICSLLNGEELSGQDVVRAIKKKIMGKNVVSQRHSLDLLEACAMNCDKVFSEIASEKVLDEMVRMINNPQTHFSNRQKALQLIRAWGESSEELGYLPVFHQTYMILKGRGIRFPGQEGESLEPFFTPMEPVGHEQPSSLPASNANGNTDPRRPGHDAFTYHGHNLSSEERKEILVVARNSIELLSSMSNSNSQNQLVMDELTLSIVEKCRQSMTQIQRIIESSGDDEGFLFEALNVHDELQQVLSRYSVADKPTVQREAPSANEPTHSAENSSHSAANSGQSKEKSGDSKGNFGSSNNPGNEGVVMNYWD
ncbi:hypothetical protein AMTRI_Chr07g24080 [Amborella trichopoda]